MAKGLGVLGRAAIERRHGVDGPASRVLAEYDAEAKRVEKRRKTLSHGYSEEINRVRIVVDDAIPFMAVLISADVNGIWLSTDTLDVIDDMPPETIFHLTSDVKKWGPGMRYLVQEGGKYTEQAKAAMKTEKELIPAKDPLTMLEEDANRLVVKAASLNENPTESQLRLFAEQLADLRKRFAAVDAQRERTEGLIDLAAVAITDALE